MFYDSHGISTAFGPNYIDGFGFEIPGNLKKQEVSCCKQIARQH